MSCQCALEQRVAELEARCARLEAALRAALPQTADAPADEPLVEELLPPCTLAFELGLSESYTRKLCRHAFTLGMPGVERVGPGKGRWRATRAAIEALR